MKMETDGRSTLLRETFVKIRALGLRRPMLIAAIAGIIAALFASGYLTRREAEILEMVEPVSVVVATRNIQRGELINETSLGSIDIPKKFIQPGFIGDLRDAAGRIAMIPISSGTQVTSSVARRRSGGFGLSGVIPEGRRAISTGVDDISGVAGLIAPSDMVDVIATFDLKREGGVESTSLLLIENVEVLSVGKRMAAPQLSSKKNKRSGVFGGGKRSMSGGRGWSVTLSLTPEQSQLLVYSNRNGHVDLSLRPLGDENMEDGLASTTIKTIVSGHAELAPKRKIFREYRGR